MNVCSSVALLTGSPCRSGVFSVVRDTTWASYCHQMVWGLLFLHLIVRGCRSILHQKYRISSFQGTELYAALQALGNTNIWEINDRAFQVLVGHKWKKLEVSIWKVIFVLQRSVPRDKGTCPTQVNGPANHLKWHREDWDSSSWISGHSLWVWRKILIVLLVWDRTLSTCYS